MHCSQGKTDRQGRKRRQASEKMEVAKAMNYMDQYKFWLEDSYFDEGTKEELRKIADNQAEIEDRFYKDLAFGTGGLRGVIGAGTNRMNIYTVRKATQGLANYILKQGGADKGVAIAYDSRYYSPEFADEAALCMAANGIKAYVFDELRPTPELSFALRTLGCISGIVVTASHNPPEYNGYKVYWEDGAQLTAPKDHEIIDEVEHVTDFHTVKTMSKDDAIEAGLYQYIGELYADVKVVRNDEITIPEIEALAPDHIIVSPGPGRPKEAGICEEVIDYFKGKIPIFGVCLGHQAICEAYGGEIIHAKELMHGKKSNVKIDTASPIFQGMPEEIDAARYHSLAADTEKIPKALKVIATANDGEVMAVQHKEYPVYGLQFHPESVYTEHGKRMMENFLSL